MTDQEAFPADVPVPTLFEWAGGSAALARMIDAFYDRVERDDLLGPLFPGGVTGAHRHHVAVWWSEVFGGPADYTAHHGGYKTMLAHHRDLGITAEQRFRFASLMSLAADDAALPDDPDGKVSNMCSSLPCAAVLGKRPVDGSQAVPTGRTSRCDVSEFIELSVAIQPAVTARCTAPHLGFQAHRPAAVTTATQVSGGVTRPSAARTRWGPASHRFIRSERKVSAGGSQHPHPDRARHMR